MEQRSRYAAATASAGIFLAIGAWGAELNGPYPDLSISLMLIGALGFVGSIVWGLWPKFGHRIALGRRKLSLEPHLDDLSYAYPTSWSPAIMMEAGLAGRSFAVLRVRNKWKNDLPKIVPQCFFGSTAHQELPCFWSKESEGKFVSGGGRAGDLPVWHERVLVIAQVFAKENTWARLPKDQESMFHPGSQPDGSHYSMAGESLNLGPKVELTVTFRAAKLNQTERFLCSFDAEGPTFARA